jgi:xylan 1,4-beta-xylosidase
MGRCFFVAGAALLACPAGSAAGEPTIVVDAQARGTPFPHFYEQMFGSGTASLALRDDYRKDLAQVRQATGFSYIRFHGIFDHDVGVYHVDKDVTPSYNFSYVDEIYDGLLERGVKPFVELSFMPPEMAATPHTLETFWNRPNISPPRDYAAWNAMVTAFARHLIDRYGIDEVSSWYFEVWNEPNGFWAGVPLQETYFRIRRERRGAHPVLRRLWADGYLPHRQACIQRLRHAPPAGYHASARERRCVTCHASRRWLGGACGMELRATGGRRP